MPRKPRHLTRENARRFEQKSIVDRYHLRLPYPAQTFELLADLCSDSPHNILDVGCGTGEIARHLEKADRVDAVDVSIEMLNRGRELSNGQDNINWIHGRIENLRLQAPYSMIVGADSVQWLDWYTVFPRFNRMLTPNGCLVLLNRYEINLPWQDKLGDLIAQFSLMQDYDSYELIDELTGRGLLEIRGTKTTDPLLSMQSVDDYVQSFHSRTSLSLEDMSQLQSEEFDKRLEEIVLPHAKDGLLTLFTQVRLIWGKPLDPK